MLINLKDLFLGLLLLIVLVAGWQYFSTWRNLQEKIDAAEAAMETLNENKRNLENRVAELSARQAELDRQIADKDAAIAANEQTIRDLRAELEVANDKAVTETDEQEIADDFREAFELTEANAKVIRYAEETPSGRLFTNTFLALPVDVAKLAIIARNNEVACEQEVELRVDIDNLRKDIDRLQTENLDLERQKTQAWSEGYQEAYSMYVDINELYVDLLKTPPKVNVGPAWLQFLGGLAGGALICNNL